MLALEVLAAVVVVGTLHFMAWNQGYLRGHEDGWNDAHRTPGLDRRAEKARRKSR